MMETPTPFTTAMTNQRLVVATHNRGKMQEFATILKNCGASEILCAGDLGLTEPEETGTDFAANARLKAQAAAHATKTLALADDSGLCVTALNGNPGIYSARWAGEPRDFHRAMLRVHEELGAAQDRSACFIAALALVWPDGRKIEVEGRVDGTIVWPPRGNEGHGYDPFFQPHGFDRTFAEMTAEEKNAISHRARALEALLAAIRQTA